MMTNKNPIRVTVIGLGYVGLPLALLLADKHHIVYGIDLDPIKIQSLKKGASYIEGISGKTISNHLDSKRLVVTSSYEPIEKANVVAICVPTPLASSDEPDLQYLIDAGDKIGARLRQQSLVILESSTYPGTTRNVLLPLLERDGKKAGTDFYLGYSPERIDPGSPLSLSVIPKIVSGITEKCQKIIYDFYRKIFLNVTLFSTPEAAELTKLLENSYRFVNISFINEFAFFCDMLQVNVWEIIEAAKTKPFGFSAFYPGPGAGGHCIPVDPIYLSWKAKEIGMSSLLIEAADMMNKKMPKYIVEKVKKLLSTEDLSSEINVL
ncbi:nucleotide sugar dehydrogenase [Aneurinibacillus sp. Ricciae_BoGa-3]|uniref:nucleotide sugar dehydrogenase n=1 Tax=Aneurinibacillus sp. Ricciae_BoGa-3 TaxID=3022697 RepID=UPI00234273EF|nr:nucleotide sugar dehydrogenase [Aneurinibacillus sp. Ricciae_BoGa-3]WCK55876.1 nucleotide sugar dehydrogenase [Aneurinibacillus sp. Ricciae_BoGa-3]